jgi:hypothetical protein
MRQFRACLILLAATACGQTQPRQVQRPSEAETVLRRALAARPEGINFPAGTCIYLRLEPPQVRPPASVHNAPLTRIDPAWLRPGTPVTEERYGCANAATYSQPVLERSPSGELALATIEIAHLCGPVCGETGTLTFYRRPGRTDWEEPIFIAGPML